MSWTLQWSFSLSFSHGDSMPRPPRYAAVKGTRQCRPGPSVGRQQVHEYPGSEYDDEERELLRAVDRYREEHHIRFPSVTDVLKVVRELGYKRDSESKQPSIQTGEQDE